MLQVSVGDKNNYSIEQEDGQWLINGAPVGLDINQHPNGLISIISDGKSYTAIIESIDRKTKETTLRINGQLYKTGIKDPLDLLLNNIGLDLQALQKIQNIKAPMPGMVLKVLVTVGQQINKGDALIILEAMKMENVLKANGPATVKSIKATERTAVEKGAILIELE